MPKVSNKKLRRAAPRVDDVFTRNKGKSPAIASYEGTIKVSAATLIVLYDGLLVLGGQRRQTKEVRAEYTATLLGGLRRWVGPASLHVPTLRAADFRPRPEVPDDVISAVTGFLAVVDEHELQTGVPLPFSEELHTQLAPTLEAAKQEWIRSADAEVTYTRARRALRLVCEQFHAHLVAFRRTIGQELGTDDPDYQRLRISKIRGDEEDEELEDEATEPTLVPGEAAAE